MKIVFQRAREGVRAYAWTPSPNSRASMEFPVHVQQLADAYVQLVTDLQP